MFYSIEAALECGKFDEVMVSTDDVEIAQLAQQAGASVPFLRSERTSGDLSTTADVIEEVLEEYATARSQDLEPLYHDSGQFCCFKTEEFIKK